MRRMLEAYQESEQGGDDGEREAMNPDSAEDQEQEGQGEPKKQE